MAPPKYYEAQASGLSFLIDYNPVTDTGRRSSRAFLSPFPNQVSFSLPVIIEFPENTTAEARYNWYAGDNTLGENGSGVQFFSTNIGSQGDAAGIVQDKIDAAYRTSKKWVRRGKLESNPNAWNPSKGVSYTEAIQYAPIINAETGEIRFEKIPANTVLGADLGKAKDEALGELGVTNYLLPYNQSKKANILTNQRNKNIPIFEKEPSQAGQVLPGQPFVQANVGRAPQDVPFDVSEISGGIPQAQLEAGIKGIPESEKLLTQRTKGVTLQQQSKNSIKEFLSDPDGYNLGGVLDGSLDFEFTMDNNGQLTSLNVFQVIDGKKQEEPNLIIITNDTSRATVNDDYTKFKIQSLTAKPDDSLDPPDTTKISPKGTSTLSNTMGVGQGGIGSFALGQNLMAPGVPMPGSLQQQALSRVPINEYREALPAAMPGGGIPLMRGLSKTPLQLAQEAYFLASRMGTFQPQGTIPGGKGAFEFQQYLGGQPDYIADLQAGLGAIQQVKEKIISGISPTQLTSAERQIYDNYIGGTEDDPYLGGERELALRQQLTQLLPAPLRQSALTNLQNTYNQALATRPSTVAGMPQSLMYGGALGAGSPFQSMQPMNVTVPTGTSPVGTMGTMGAPSNVSTPSNVVNAPVNMDRGPSSTNNQVTGGLNAPPITTGNVGVNINVPGQGTRVQLMSEEEADMYYTNLLNSGQLDVLTKQQILASGRYPKVAEANEYIMKYGMSKEQETQRRVAGAQAQAAQAAAVEKAKQDVINANIAAAEASQAIIGMDEWKKLGMPGGLPPAMSGMPGSNAFNTTTMTLGGKKIQPVPFDPTQNVPLPFDRRFNNMEFI